MVHAVTNIATFFIPIDISFTEGMLISRPSSFSLGFVGQDRPLSLPSSRAEHASGSLDILNSNKEPLQLLDCSVVSDNQADAFPVLLWRNRTLTPYEYRAALDVAFYDKEEGEFGGRIVIQTNSSVKALQRIVVEYDYTYSDYCLLIILAWWRAPC